MTLYVLILCNSRITSIEFYLSLEKFKFHAYFLLTIDIDIWNARR